ncbi:MAG: hypothetical protein BWY76_00152 [bacterium ADurb.Bin429]|nr:MAG: hypothetical protein BWY76_00152 [bacterium ADurb.Bin429]
MSAAVGCQSRPLRKDSAARRSGGWTCGTSPAPCRPSSRRCRRAIDPADARRRYASSSPPRRERRHRPVPRRRRTTALCRPNRRWDIVANGAAQRRKPAVLSRRRYRVPRGERVRALASRRAGGRTPTARYRRPSPRSVSARRSPCRRWRRSCRILPRRRPADSQPPCAHVPGNNPPEHTALHRHTLYTAGHRRRRSATSLTPCGRSPTSLCQPTFPSKDDNRESAPAP